MSEKDTVITLYSKKDNKFAFSFVCLYLIYLLFNKYFQSSLYTFILLLMAMVFLVFLDSKYLLPPLLLVTLLESWFQVSSSMGFTRVLALMYIGKVLIEGIIKGYSVPKRFALEIGLIATIAIYVFMSILWSITSDFSSTISFVMSMLLILAMFFAEKENIEELFSLLNITALIFSIFIFINILINIESITSTQVNIHEDINNNSVAMGLAQCVAILLGWLIVSKRKWIKIVNIITIFINFICVLYLGSRTVLLAMLLGVLLLPLLIRNPAINKKSILKIYVFSGLAIIGIIFIVFMINPDIMDRFTFDSEAGNATVLSRFYIWEAVLKHVVPKNFFLGVGFGLNNVLVAVTPYVERAYHAHNLYIAVLAELGTIGFFLIMGFIGKILTSLIKSKNLLSIIPLLMLVIALINGVGEEMINHRSFWFIFGLALISLRETVEN